MNLKNITLNTLIIITNLVSVSASASDYSRNKPDHQFDLERLEGNWKLSVAVTEGQAPGNLYCPRGTEGNALHEPDNIDQGGG